MHSSWKQSVSVGFLFAVLLVVSCNSALGQITLPAVPFPPENPLTEPKRILGKILFWEEQMSSDNTIACGTCHIPSAGGGDARIGDPVFPNALNRNPGRDGTPGTADDIIGGRGVVSCNPDGTFNDDGTFWPNPQVTGRKTPTFIGVQWDVETFWDGRAGSTFLDPVSGAVVIANGGALENQAVGPPTSDVEMSCMSRTLTDVAAKIAIVRPLRLATNLPADIAAVLNVTPAPTYPDLFNAAFGTPDVNPARIGMAIATYERTLVPDQTPFDAWQGGNPTAISVAAQNGFLHFTSAVGRCNFCHDETNGLFTDHSFRNIGVRPDVEDRGRFEITDVPLDTGAFKVPGLRNIDLRGPFFHNGGKATLAEVLVFYTNGGDHPGPNLDVDLQALPGMGQLERAEVEAFLHTLTDPRVLNETFPFDRPTLRSELNPNPVTFGSGTPGTGGFTPQMVAPIPPVIGSDHFGVGVAFANPAADAVVVFSIPGPPTPFAGGLFFPNMNPSQHIARAMTLAGDPSTPGTGYGSFMAPIPDLPFFDSMNFFGQWVVLDPAGTQGVTLSDVVQFTFILP